MVFNTVFVTILFSFVGGQADKSINDRSSTMFYQQGPASSTHISQEVTAEDNTSTTCPPWTTYRNNTRSCECLEETLHQVVLCNRVTKQVDVLFCFCMTYSYSQKGVVIGHCIIACGLPRIYHTIRSNSSDMLNQEICGLYNREGQLCGQCIQYHAPPVYSYSLKCVPCKRKHFYQNLVKYLAVSFVPLTVFYVVVMLFRISVTSGPMVAYVLLSQIVGSPILIRLLLQPKYQPIPFLGLAEKFGITSYSVWNLEIMRIIIPEFCLHPKMNTLDMLALDYFIGVYPMMLILLTYLAVSLHDRSSFIVFLWRPFYKCFNCIRKEWDIRGSLIQGFATFTILSYVKILNVSFDILTPTYVSGTNGTKSLYVYYAGTIPFLGKDHLPYACLAIVAFSLLNLMPVILLLLYPIRKFRRILEYFKLHTQVLYSFMDAFQGCYKYRPLDCRYFAGLYLLLRILQLTCFCILKDPSYLGLTGFLLLITAMLVIYVKPYKNDTHNKIDIGFFLLFSGGHFIYLFYTYKLMLEDSGYKSMLITIAVAGFILFSLPIYGIGYFIHRALPNNTKERIKRYLSRCKRQQLPEVEDPQEESLPHRMENLEDYLSLTHQPSTPR